VAGRWVVRIVRSMCFAVGRVTVQYTERSVAGGVCLNIPELE
jgi:hypothetical protein